MTQLRDLIFFFFTWITLTAIEGPSPLMFHGGNTLVTPHLFLEPHGGTRANLKHCSCLAKLGLRVGHCLNIDYWWLRDACGEKRSPAPIRDQEKKNPKRSVGATLSGQPNHSGRDYPIRVPHLRINLSLKQPCPFTGQSPIDHIPCPPPSTTRESRLGQPVLKMKANWGQDTSCHLKSTLLFSHSISTF